MKVDTIIYLAEVRTLYTQLY